MNELIKKELNEIDLSIGSDMCDRMDRTCDKSEVIYHQFKNAYDRGKRVIDIGYRIEAHSRTELWELDE